MNGAILWFSRWGVFILAAFIGLGALAGGLGR
jgi:hypothetical protein